MNFKRSNKTVIINYTEQWTERTEGLNRRNNPTEHETGSQLNQKP